MVNVSIELDWSGNCIHDQCLTEDWKLLEELLWVDIESIELHNNKSCAH